MSDFAAFSIARLPRILFGAGTFAQVPGEIRTFGTHALLVTGAQSFKEGPHFDAFSHALRREGVALETVSVAGEPTPEIVDEAVAAFIGAKVDVVVAVGGGSALDAGKAIAGLLRPGNSVMEHLEGVGPEKPYRGPAVPFIAVPTTAGTGAEATKNAVLSRHGAKGFKKSFRDDDLVAQVAVIDPEFLASCPPDVMAANGMDAFTQLLESMTSTRSNPLTEALAWSGLEAFAAGFWVAMDDAKDSEDGRAKMAYASLVSGICLAQTGLGAVHGLASPLGAFFPIPHGVVCGTLVAEATAANIAALIARVPESPALSAYGRAGELLTGTRSGEALVAVLREWTHRLALPRLSTFGMNEGDVDRVVENCRGSSMKTNPVVLSDDEVKSILMDRL